MSEHRLAAVALTVVMVLSVLSGTVVLTSDTAVAAGETTTQTSPRFEVVDAKANLDGDLVVTVEATSDKPVSDFRFWNDDLDGGGTIGPTELGDGNFRGATYDNGTPFNPGDTLAQSDGDRGQVIFTFDSGATAYDYEADAFRINATAYDASYSSADTGNRSVAEFNYYRLTAKDHTGTTLKGTPVMLYNATTNASAGFRTTSEAGGFTLDCHGVAVSGTCTDPDTGSPGEFSRYTQTYPAPLAVETFALSQANASGKTEVSRGPATLTADQPTSPTFISWEAATVNSTVNVDSVTFTNAETGTVVWRSANVQSELLVPAFLKPTTRYTVTLRNRSSFGTVNRSLTFPTKGLSDAEFRIATGSAQTSEVTGQVVNESGAPVADAVVMAQPESSTSGQSEIYNSTLTDSNGLFSMQVPETDQLNEDIAFRIVGTDTDGGTPIYYPTIDANDGQGYVVQSGQTVIPPLTLQQGGRVDIDVTNNASQDKTLPSKRVLTSISEVSAAYPSVTRTDGSYAFNTFAFGQNTPPSASVSMMSPTTDSDSQVSYNVWENGGELPEPAHVCVGTPSVSQGASTDSQCELDDTGYLNIGVQQYDSIRQQSSSKPADVESPGFFFENVLVVKNASSDEVVTYLGGNTIQQFFLGGDGDPSDVRIPVPEGDYHVELRPRFEFTETTSVVDSASYTVSANSSTNVQLDRGDAFRIRRASGRFNPSLTRDADNTLAVRVYDPATATLLNGSDMTVTAQLRHPNGTVASDRVTLGYNSTDKTHDTTTLKPSALGVDAGTYQLALTASYADSGRTYNSTVTGPAQISGFQTGIDLRSRTVQPGGTLNGDLFAFGDSGAIAADKNNISIAVYNQNGRQVSKTTAANGISSGKGSLAVTMPDEPGHYRVATRIVSDGGKQGIASRWVRVTELELDAETDRRVYAPQDTVRLTVEATNATTGNGIENASITARVNGARVSTATDGNGKATLELDPATYGGTNNEWQRGHGISVQLNYRTETGVVTKTTGTGFEVRQFSVRAEPTARSFTPSENATIGVRVPTTQSVNSVAVTELDGSSVRIDGSRVTNPSPGLYRVDVGQRAVGEHIATATVTTDSATQTARTQFLVQSYALSGSLSSRQVSVGESVTVDVSVRDPDGTAVSGQSVTASLNSTNPVRQQASDTATTDSNGDASISLSSSRSGFHFVKVDVGQQTRYLGLQVSSVDVTFEDANGNPVGGYQAEPGTTQTIHVNATDSNSGAAVAKSTVTAAALVYGEPVELGQATTTNGEASINFTVPSSVPAREYGLGVQVSGDSATGTATGTLNVTGANAYEIDARTTESALSPGDTVEFRSVVTTGDGSPVANKRVDFVVQSDGSADQRVATVQTNSDGVATYDYAVPADASDGEYVLQTALSDSSSIQSYTGFTVRSLDVSVSAEDGPFTPGDDVNLTVTATDSTTGAPVAATGGSIRLTLPGSSVETSLSPSGQSPYTTAITLPADSSITGTRSISVTVQNGSATDTDSTLVEVRDASESANLSIAEPVVAGQATTVTVNATVDTTGVLTAYSPGANTVANNTSVAVASSSDTTAAVTIDSPGTHIVRLSVPGVGTVTEVIDVQAASNEPTVWTGTGVSANATEFSGSEDIYVKSNKAGMTATVVGQNATRTIALDSQSGDTYYGVLSADRPEDIYLVRLDSASATSVADTIIEVGA